MQIEPSVSYVCFHYKIPEASKLTELWSPKFLLHGVLWKFLITKRYFNHKPLLGIYLYCENKKSSEDWSYAASATFKILTFGDKPEFEEIMNPFVFDKEEAGFGKTSFVTWNDLFDVDKCYVKNDTVNLELKIDVADPFDETKIKFARHSNTKFRLMVTNISNLMAARSPPFMFHKLPFNLVVYRSHLSHLGVYLYQRGEENDLQFKITLMAKIISSEKTIFIQKSNSNVIRNGTLYVQEIISWDVLFDARNAFVANNSVIIEVELS